MKGFCWHLHVGSSQHSFIFSRQFSFNGQQDYRSFSSTLFQSPSPLPRLRVSFLSNSWLLILSSPSLTSLVRFLTSCQWSIFLHSFAHSFLSFPSFISLIISIALSSLVVSLTTFTHLLTPTAQSVSRKGGRQRTRNEMQDEPNGAKRKKGEE